MKKAMNKKISSLAATFATGTIFCISYYFDSDEAGGLGEYLNHPEFVAILTSILVTLYTLLFIAFSELSENVKFNYKEINLKKLKKNYPDNENIDQELNKLVAKRAKDLTE